MTDTSRTSRARNRARRLGGALLLMAAAAFPAGCRPGADRKPRPMVAPLLLVGMDGLDWSVALPLIREGRMPHLQELMLRGTFGRLETLTSGKSPAIWTTIATGRLPAEHGVLDFILEAPEGGARLYTSADRRTKALWNILTDYGRRSCIVSWWNTFPAEEIDGVLVAQANTLEQLARRRILKPGGMLYGVEGQVHPPARQDEMLRVAAAVDGDMPALLRGIFGDIGRSRRPGDKANLDACAWAIRGDEVTRRIALKLAAESPPPDLLAVYFGAPDVVSHRFWRFHEPDAFVHRPPPDAVAQFGGVVRDAYAHADSVLGELIAALPPEATVLVVSDHGMHAVHTTSRFDVPVHGRLERESGGHDDGPPGIFAAAGPLIRRSGAEVSLDGAIEPGPPPAGHVMDITPTVLALLGLPVGRDMGGRILEDVLVEGYLRDHAVAHVDTHDSDEWLASRDRAPAEVPGAEERLEQLRSLGYIQSPVEDGDER